MWPFWWKCPAKPEDYFLDNGFFRLSLLAIHWCTDNFFLACHDEPYEQSCGYNHTDDLRNEDVHTKAHVRLVEDVGDAGSGNKGCWDRADIVELITTIEVSSSCPQHDGC